MNLNLTFKNFAMGISMNKLEIYGIALALMAILFFGAYAKGRLDEKTSIQTQQQAANAKTLQDELTASLARTKADNDSRDVALNYLQQIKGHFDAIQSKYAGLPNVIVDTHGCPTISPNFKLRWDAAANLSTGSSGDVASADTATPLRR